MHSCVRRYLLALALAATLAYCLMMDFAHEAFPPDFNTTEITPTKKIETPSGNVSAVSKGDIFSGVQLDPEDPLILDFIRKNHLFAPSSKDPLRVNKGSLKLAKNIWNALKPYLLKKDQGGFFIECGANDGVFLSNTLGLEVNYNWTGLLIESSPSLWERLRETNRKAWMANVCLSGKVEQIEFLMHKDKVTNWRIGNGKINPLGKYDLPFWTSGQELFKREDYYSEGTVNCFPLLSLLSALNVSSVDFFSLDVEGHEYKILEHIPFDKTTIKVIIVEFWVAPEGKDAIKDLLLGKGYELILETESDFVFVLKTEIKNPAGIF